MALARDGLKRLILRSIGSCQYSSSASYLRTWKPTNNPCVAQARLATIRKDYKLQVSELRKQYYDELQAQKWEEDAKAQLQRKRIMAAKEKRKTAKKQQARLLAVQRQKHQTAFREMLLKEKAEKAKRQTDKLQLIERRRAREKELLRKKSSLWIDEKDLDRKIMEAFVDTTQLLDATGMVVQHIGCGEPCGEFRETPGGQGLNSDNVENLAQTLNFLSCCIPALSGLKFRCWGSYDLNASPKVPVKDKND